MKLIPEVKSLFQGNIKTLAVRELLITVATGVTGGLDSLYVKEILGADAVTLGMLASLWSVSFLLFIWISGWLSSYYDQKKILLLGTALTIPNPLIFALTPDWRLTIIVNILAALGTALVAPSKVSLLFSSSEQKSRSRSIAMITTLTNLANAIVPPIGAIAIQSMGGLNEIRKMFLIQFVFSVAVYFYTSRALKNKHENRRSKSKNLTAVIKDIFTQMGEVYKISKERKARAWLFLSLTGPWAWEIVGPFWIIYAAEECGSSLTILGLLTAVYSITSVLFLLPLANLSDKKGRKKVILLTRPFLYLCVISLLIGGTIKTLWFVPFIPIIAWIFRAIGSSSGPSWTAASTEVIPEELQGKWEATRDFLWRCMAIPASFVGGIFWSVDPRLPFLFAILVDGLLRFPTLIYFIPETLIVHRFRPKQLGRHIVLYGLPGSGQTSIARLIKKNLVAEVVDEHIILNGSRGKLISIPLDERGEIHKKINEVLDRDENTVIIEGKPALFAAEAEDKATIILLVASKEERVRRKSKNVKEPEFVIYREIESRDREFTKITKKLYGADVSKLPPFDIAINTERIPLEKVVQIIAVLHNNEEDD